MTTICSQLKIPILFFLLLFTSLSCNRLGNKAKETINKSGETVGKTATEFFEGISEGIDKTLQCEIILSQALTDKGVKTGKFTINSSPDSGNNHLLTLYLIFDQDFHASVMAKACDKNGLEVGRSRLGIENQAGNAGYYDFVFDKRTHVEAKSKIFLE